MFESVTIKLFAIILGCGVVGSLLGLAYAVLGRGGKQLRVEIATGIGFLIGGAIGAMVGIYMSMLARL
jgi:hypothetical protein